MLLLLPMLIVRLFNPHATELLKFTIWITLAVLVVQSLFQISVTQAPATEFMRQILDRTNEDYLNGGITFNFPQIGHAGDFYEWLRSSLSSVLFAGQENTLPGPGNFLPGMDIADAVRRVPGGNPPPRGGSVVVPYSCNIRQLRSRMVACPRLPARWCIPRFSEETEEKTPRSNERFLPHGYINEAGAPIKPMFYNAHLSKVSYPSEGGFVPALTNAQGLESAEYASGEWPAHWNRCGLKYNTTISKYGKRRRRRLGLYKVSVEKTFCCSPACMNGYGPDSFVADVNRLEQSKWIDGRTAFVHVTFHRPTPPQL